ncbi:MAG: 30S ribosomal protein S2 [Bacteroidota bacterium]
MSRTTFKELLDAGVHFGHLKRKWNPKMAPYIYMERNGIHVIDLHKTMAKLDEAANAMKQIAKSGRKILFVSTKKQAKEIVKEKVDPLKMPYVTERWPGGLLTNFRTIKKTIKKMSTIEKNMEEGVYDTLSKRERLAIARQKDKLEKNFGSIANMGRVPSAVFVVDVLKEHIAVKEAQKLNLPLFATVDTNSDPTGIDFPVPANDDASKSIALILDVVTKAVEEGLNERQLEKEKSEAESKKEPKQEKESKEKEKTTAEKPRRSRARKITTTKKETSTTQQKEGKEQTEKKEKADVKEKRQISNTKKKEDTKQKENKQQDTKQKEPEKQEVQEEEKK